MERSKIFAVFLALSAIAVIAALSSPFENSPEAVFQTSMGETNVELEIASTDEEKTEGLMNRESLCQRCGMLFLYNDSSYRTFWMKNTTIPLDIIFISSDKEVINVETAYPEPNTSDEDLTRYESSEPAQYIVEANAGFAEEKGIRKGTEVRLLF